MRILRRSTETTVQLGPFVDATDGFTAETALVVAANQVELFKAGAVAAVDISTRAWQHISAGLYRVTLLATDLDQAGPLTIRARPTGARQVWHEFNVLAATSYDTMTSGAALPANVSEVAGNGIAAVNLALAMIGMQQFTVGSGSTVDRIATDLTQTIAQHWKDRTIIMFSGPMRGQQARITGYNGATKELMVIGLTQAPAPGDSAIIV